MAPSANPSFRMVAVAMAAALSSGASCSGGNHRTTAPETPPAPVEEAELSPDLRLLVITDLSGYLEPCGCTSRPLGGIDRMSARVERLRAEQETPTLLLAAGNLLFHEAEHGVSDPEASTQEIWKGETLAGVLQRLELNAATFGPSDFAHGVDEFVRIASEADLPLVAAGIGRTGHGDGGESPSAWTSTRQLTVGGLQVGVVGLTDLRGADGRPPAGLSAAEGLEPLAQEAVTSLRAEGADLVIALVNADRRAGRALASVDGIDVVVQGGLDRADANPPLVRAGTTVLHAGRQGQGLVVADLCRHNRGPWVDASAWTRRTRRTHLEAQIAQLREQIAQWESSDEVDPSDLARQRQRLDRLSSDARTLSTFTVPPNRNVFAARYEELAHDADRDRAITSLIDRYDRRVNEHNARVFANLAPEPAPEGTPHYVGTERCRTCHAAAGRWWDTTQHGRAYATLSRQHKNFNLSCVGCHVTGYQRPGGSTVTHVDGLENVGCESCHGPGSMHAQAPNGADVNVVRSPTEQACRGCHNPEHSDSFHFQTYRRMMIAPGHGLPNE